ncbi:MAG: helix-turn-helix domain-containing protein [Patescibacteria group bacterium]|jgi:sugar-specific transcriptional regulator TrmB
MLTTKLKQDLLKLGLSDNEIKFYVAGLELGLATIPQIAERASLSRMSGYNIFKTLSQKGMADMDVRSYGQKCKVAKPAKLLTLFEDTRKSMDKLATNLPNLIGELNVLYASVPEDLEIHYFRAKEAVTKIWDEALTNTKKGDDILTLSAVDFAPTFGEQYVEFLEELALRCNEKGIHHKMILEKTGTYTLERRVITELFPESVQMKLGATCEQMVYADYVAYIFPGRELFGISIHNRELANHHSRIFYTLWNKMYNVG